MGRIHFVSLIDLHTSLAIVNIVNIFWSSNDVFIKICLHLGSNRYMGTVTGFLGHESHLHAKCMKVAFQGKFGYSSFHSGFSLLL